MNDWSVATILANDLDSMIHRVEGLPAHPRYTDALGHIQKAKQAVEAGRIDLHRQMTERLHGIRKGS